MNIARAAIESSGWEKTSLWGLLIDNPNPEAKHVVSVLRLWLPDIEHVLKSGGTAPLDFTLHDADHSFRVAQRMVGIIPKDVIGVLSPYELALLLLSAYLHDIGMTPEERIVSSHYNYLLSGQKNILSDSQISDFQKWVDDTQTNISIPMSKSTPTPDELKIAKQLIAHYCRSKHNDWSGMWIEKHAPTSDLYADWKIDLIKLCQSHHYDKAELQDKEFNPRKHGPSSLVVHLRYLSCVLRLADILEFDPKRTPPVVFQHRDVSEASEVYWRKDHSVSVDIEEGSIKILARPKTAVIHRAIEVMAHEIDCELRVCQSINLETPFSHLPISSAPLPHKWGLNGNVQARIQPFNDSYEYIDGAFRPNTEKILQLLSGNALYGDSMVAVRELLQNAFDAVKEEIAHKRLQQPNPLDEGIEISLGNTYQVKLRMMKKEEGYFLVCTDNGVGMTKQIIQKYLLVSGQSRRHEVLDLARRCQSAGFTLERTGEFGIGVLSYFMIADGLIIRTQRSLAPRDADATGWRFEIGGVGSFGELRKDSTIPTGSTVELRLRSNLFSDPIQWFDQLVNYISQTVQYVPCRFTVESDQPGSKKLSYESGWTNSSSYFSMVAMQGLENDRDSAGTPVHLLPSKTKEKIENLEEHFNEIRNSVRESVKWKIKSGILPHGTGRYRFHLPYFESPLGISIAYFSFVSSPKRVEILPIGKGHYYCPAGFNRLSWKGMLTHRARGRHHWYDESFMYRERDLKGYLEVDFFNDSSSTINVDRHHVSLSEEAVDAIATVRNELNQWTAEIFNSDPNSHISLINRRLLKSPDISVKEPVWIYEPQNPSDGTNAFLAPITYPVMTSSVWAYGKVPDEVRWKDSLVAVLRSIRDFREKDHYQGLYWCDSKVCPDRILKRNGGMWSSPIAAVWDHAPFTKATATVGLQSKFPPNWSRLSGVRIKHYHGASSDATIWNMDNILVKALCFSDWDWVTKKIKENPDHVPIKDELLKDRSKAIAWVLWFLVDSDLSKVWEGISERDQDFLKRVWKMIFDDDQCHATLWIDDTSDSRLRMLSPKGWEVAHETKEINNFMPDPGPDWTLEVPQDETRLIYSHTLSMAHRKSSRKKVKRQAVSRLKKNIRRNPSKRRKMG